MRSAQPVSNGAFGQDALLGAGASDDDHKVAGADEDEALSELSDEAFRGLCAELDSLVVSDDAVVLGGCRGRAALAAAGALDAGAASDACEPADACVANGPVSYCASIRPICAVTVKQLSDCAAALRARWKEISTASCEDLLAHYESLFDSEVESPLPAPSVIGECDLMLSACF